jgi:hypothetical protein
MMVLWTLYLELVLKMLHVWSTSVTGNSDVPQTFENMTANISINIPFLLHYSISRGSTVGIATAYGLENGGPDFESL